MASIAKASIWYARHGWYVVPLHAPLFDHDGNLTGCTCEAWRRRKQEGYTCPTPGKHPILSGWEDNASVDTNTIIDWWQRWPWANVGIAAGKSGILAFDIDSYKDTYDGVKVLSTSDENTITNLSGGGGAHLIYQLDEDDYYTNAKGTLPPGIDIRCYGGQFVAPPSIHPSGNRYQWEAGYGPHEIHPLPLPDAIRAILNKQLSMRKAQVVFTQDVPAPDMEHLRLRSEIIEMINNPPERGGRSEADQSVITALVAIGATDDEIKAIFTHYPIGKHGKFAEKGANALTYLTHSIAHARTWIDVKREEKADERTQQFFTVMALG